LHYNQVSEVIVLPGLDRTGPFGTGPMTGRKLGNCNYVAKPKLLGYGFRKNKQYKKRYFQYFAWLIPSAMIGVYYVLKTGTKNSKKGR